MNKGLLQPPPPQLKNIMVQMVLMRSLSVIGELGIADILDFESKTIDELATATQTDTSTLFRLIRVLSSHDIFQIDADGNISNTETSHFLRSDKPGSQRNLVRMMGSEWMWKVFNNLEHSVKTGEKAFDKAFPGSENLFQYFKQGHQQDGLVFSQSMSAFSYTFDQPLVNAYNFSKFEHIVDVGGAQGKLLHTIKNEYPDLKATLFDLPDVVQLAEKNDTENVLEYCGGNFFEEIPVSADGIIIKYVLHNWDDNACIKILQNCRKSIQPNGKLLIMDMLLKNGEKQVFENSLDIVMLMLLGAKERTEEDFKQLLTQTNFKLERIIPSQCPLSILEIVPI